MSLSEEQKKNLSDLFARKRREKEAEHAASTEVLALKITYEDPAPDGTFEILFMTREEANKWQNDQIISGRWATSKDVTEEVSFTDGVRLAKQPDCCGGLYALKDARKFQQINPVVQALGLEI
ncbi:MAG: hypothetical protein LRZ85_10150 [Alphaproteobacteria bacterium]|nr:hypothetical protein [Alphaproteobacteria bacterium]MCD8519937.1 hypothetical protein [Alphaproteobacteria bacterium]MCD8525697.1 hypothetical protein [Alphaproteobacteria bacterium]MCD8570686.1 hypothetical protein [Alphaproteobacteria bacterium]